MGILVLFLLTHIIVQIPIHLLKQNYMTLLLHVSGTHFINECPQIHILQVHAIIKLQFK